MGTNITIKEMMAFRWTIVQTEFSLMTKQSFFNISNAVWDSGPNYFISFLGKNLEWGDKSFRFRQNVAETLY